MEMGSSPRLIVDPLYREHVMLLCSSQEDCDNAAIDSIKEALHGGQLCVYASVHNGDSMHIQKISSQIERYNDDVRDGNLVIIDFKPYFQSALAGDLAPFNHLKEQVEQLIQDRIAKAKSDRVLIFAEAAGALSESKCFDKSIDLESWWNNVHSEWLSRKLNITVICPHPSLVLNENSTTASNAKEGLSHTHTLTVELEKLKSRKKHSSQKIKVLIMEPDKDICTIYNKYLEDIGIESTIVQNSKDAIKIIFESDRQEKKEKEDGQQRVAADHEHHHHYHPFDLIIMDINPRDSSALSLSKRIWAKFPNQRIIFTTTYSGRDINLAMNANGIPKGEVLVKPFTMATFLSLMKPRS